MLCRPCGQQLAHWAGKAGVTQLRELGQPSSSMLFAVLLKAAKAVSGSRMSTAYLLPSSANVDWQAPENLL